MDPLQIIFQQVKGTSDPAAGGANELLVQLVRKNPKGFRFGSERAARCHENVNLLLEMEIAVWEPLEILGVQVGGNIRLSPSVAETLHLKVVPLINPDISAS